MGMNTPSTVEGLKTYILNRLIDKKIDDETIPILSNLININKAGLITFESQPSECKSSEDLQNFKVYTRAYLNGLFPRNLVILLATELIKLNDKITISETVLHDNIKNDHLNLINFIQDDIPLVYGLYPMICIISDQNVQTNKIKWLSGYSGNVTYPMCREYITDHFFEVPPKLTLDIINEYSLIQIWSRNMDDDIFPTILQALHNTF